MLTAAGQNVAHHGGVADIPGRATRQGIAGMPRKGDDAAPLMMGYQLVMDSGEGNAVQVLSVAHLDAAQVKAHHGGIVATGLLRVAAPKFRLRGICDARPVDAIERIILMSHHIASDL